MGSLNVPTTGTVYVDANILIYSIEAHPLYAPVIAPLWLASNSGAIEVVGSELLLLETLIGPMRTGDTLLQASYEQAMTGSDRRLLPITSNILREAARLRAAIPALRTPDAIHAATALLFGCVLFLTNDSRFKSIAALPVVTLDDILASP